MHVCSLLSHLSSPDGREGAARALIQTGGKRRRGMGLEEGLKEGNEEGLEEGNEEGLEEGKEEGE